MLLVRYGGSVDARAESCRRAVKERILSDILGSVQDSTGGGWRVLITDDFTTRVLSSALKMSDILDCNVSVVEDLQKVREPLTQAAIYFITPTAKSVARLCADFEQKPLYPSAHIFFSSKLPGDALQKIKDTPALIKVVKTLKEVRQGAGSARGCWPQPEQRAFAQQDRACRERNAAHAATCRLALGMLEQAAAANKGMACCQPRAPHADVHNAPAVACCLPHHMASPSPAALHLAESVAMFLGACAHWAHPPSNQPAAKSLMRCCGCCSPTLSS